jgi:amino acid adenylation domain-containing protein/non-ribosomal peptide synthase protein (TIGR01720 family)
LSKLTTEIHELATSAECAEHAAFWKAAWERTGGDFRLRQTWQSYALPWGPEPVCTLEFDDTGEAGRFLREASHGNDLAIFVVVLAGVFQVLRKYTGRESVFVDSPPLLTGSESEYHEPIPLVAGGCFSENVRNFLNCVRETVAESYSYQDFPIREFAENFLELRPCPVSNVLIRFEGLHEPAIQDDTYDLAIRITPGWPVKVELRANPRVFTQHYVNHFGRHLGNVLAGYRNGDLPIAQVPFIDEEERRRLVAAPQAGRVEGTVLDRFAARVAALPESVAVAAEGAEITYAVLDDQSSRLAHLLRGEYGIEKGDVVGVLCDRSPDWVVGILAILKAGAVYLPLDPEYPENRIRLMIEDAKVKAFLVHSTYLSLLTDFWSIPMVALDFQLSTLAPTTATGAALAHGGDAAYIIYTSGSTGTPKGVVLCHSGLLNMAEHHVEAFGFDSSDGLAQFYSPSFDGSMMEIFVALLAGARLVLTPPATIRDPQLFSEYLERMEVTTVNAPPMYLRTLDWNRLDSVRRVISAGDSAVVEDAQRLAATRSYHNSYGPTEATVCVTDYVVEPGLTYGLRIPVGKPIRNVRIYLLDDELNAAPEGCAGEVCISGIALARGYLNREDLTRVAFVSNPFEPGGRLYRTGDLGVWLPDGNLEIVGRKDAQVKIRGYRVEPGEIEAVLLGHPAVSEAAVVAREDALGNKQLLACVAPEKATAAELRDHLKTRLPEFMLPSGFAFFEKLPVTASGKLDRQRLASALIATAPKESHAGPQNAIQERLAQIWSEVLGIKGVGIHDNFFELGGDSILVIQVVSRSQQAGIRITARQHLEYPTIDALSRLALDASVVQPDQGIVTGPAPLTPVQRWFFSQEMEDPHHYNQSAMVEVGAGLQPGVIERAMERLIQHHDALRLAFFRSADGWEQLHATPPLMAAVGTTSLEGLTSEARESTILAEATRLQASFHLSEAPLLRLHLFQSGVDQPSLLFVIAHHLIIDGVSWRILLEDLYKACLQIEAGEVVQLPAKTTSFRDWAACLAEYSQREFEGRGYWRQKAIEARRIPAAMPAGWNLSAEPVPIAIEIGAEQASALLHDGLKALNARIEEILLAALAPAIRGWTGQNAILIDMEAHGREEIFEHFDVSRTIGWFTAMYPLLLYIEEGNAPTAQLHSVKEQLRSVPINGVGYGIARYLSNDPEMASMPAAPILFNYLGQIDRGTAGPWRPLLRDNGPEHSPRSRRSHPLEIEGAVFEGQLRITWLWNGGRSHLPAAEMAAQTYKENLLRILESSRSPEALPLTSSDFPAGRIDRNTLDVLVSRATS